SEVESSHLLSRTLMPGDNRNARGHIAVGQGDTGISTCGDRGRDAWNNLIRNTSGLERGHFLSKPAEDARVASLEPHHLTTGLGVLDHQAIDFLLRQHSSRPMSAEANPFGGGWSPPQQ